MNQWPLLLKAGTVTVNKDGFVRIEGFEFERASCRQAAQIAMALAIENIGSALTESLSADQPERSSID